MQKFLMLASAVFQKVCSMTEVSLKLVFRSGSVLQHDFSCACNKLPYHT